MNSLTPIFCLLGFGLVMHFFGPQLLRLVLPKHLTNPVPEASAQSTAPAQATEYSGNLVDAEMDRLDEVRQESAQRRQVQQAAATMAAAAAAATAAATPADVLQPEIPVLTEVLHPSDYVPMSDALDSTPDYDGYLALQDDNGEALA